MNFTKYISVIYTLVLGFSSGFLAYFLGLPAPFLMGPAVFVTLGCLFGLKLELPAHLRDVCFIFIGLSMGSSATPAVIEAAKKWPISFIVLALVVYFIMFFGARILVKYFAFNPKSALLSVTPGHLSFVLAMSEDVGADTQKVALIQSIRLLALTLILPLVLTFMNLSLPVVNKVQPVAEFHWVAVLTLGAVLIGFVFKKLKFPAAYLLAGMAISTFTHITSLIEGLMPQQIIIPAFIVMGCLIGTRFKGVNLQILKSVLLPSLAYFGFALAVSALGAGLVYVVTGVPFAQLVIAFTPGGVEAMIAMALLLNADPTFVAAHHIMRLFILAGLLPWMMSRNRE